MFQLITRVVSLLFIGLSFVGWIVFVAGYGVVVEKQKEDDSSFDPGDEPNLYAFWAASVIGPVVHILAVVHALLIPDFIRRITGSTNSCLHAIPGSIVGSITLVLFIMYMSAVGFPLVAYGIIIKEYNKLSEEERDYLDDEEEYQRAYNLMFSGGLITTIFWAVHLAFWPWFKITSGHNSNAAANIDTIPLEAQAKY